MIWNTTPPMAPGWFTASTCEPRNTNYRRHWNGWYWSAPIHHEDMGDPERQRRALTTRGETQDDVVWLHPATEAKFCMCGDGKCCASPEGLRIGRVSTISDLVCKAVSPPALVWEKLTATQIAAMRGKSVPQEIREADAAVTLAARLVDTRGTLSEQTLRQITAVDSKPTNPKDILGVRKAPMSTVSAAVMAEVGVAMLEGAAKYGRHNYRAVGVRASVYYDSTMRHLMDWWEGVDIDPDSGMSHVTKAITSLVVLRDAMLQGMVEDDRPPKAVPFAERLNAAAASVLDKHADKAPHHYTEAGR